MRKVFVHLISDQTVPNILMIEDFKKKHGDFFHVFLTTESKSNKLVNIVNTCKLSEESYMKVEIPEDNFPKIIEELGNLNLDGSELYFNVTAGTKIMSLALYEFARSKNSSDKVFYIPNNKNEIINVNNNEKSIISKRLNIKDYFSAYGVELKNFGKLKKVAESLMMRKKYTLDIWDIFQKDKDFFLSTSQKLRAYWQGEIKQNEKKIDQEKVAELGKPLFSQIGLDVSKEDKKSLKHWIKYLTGGWFEELVFIKVKEYLKLDDDYIANGVEIIKGGDNELDVVVAFENKLYYFECKTGLGEKESEVLRGTFYKLSHLKSQEAFGLGMNNILIASDDKHLYDNSGELKQKYKESIDYYRLKFFGLKDLLGDGFEKIFHEIFNTKGA